MADPGGDVDGDRFDDRPWRRLVVMASGVTWDGPWLVEKHLARAVSRHAPVLFVDPPVSWAASIRRRRLRGGTWRWQMRRVDEAIVRVTPVAPPGISRPVLREMAYRATAAAIRAALRRLQGTTRALVAASLDPLLDACPADVRVLYGTDDWVSGAALMGLSATVLARQERSQLARADVVVAISEPLADRWRRISGRPVAVVGNGCDADFFAASDSVERAADITLPEPIAGFVGHVSERIDLALLEAIADSGASLLLVGPRSHVVDGARLERLLAQPNVQATGVRPFVELPRYLRAIKVGLTPYTMSAFNQSSFPLKTLEYLAAGRSVVTTDLPSTAIFPPGLVTRAQGAEFVAAVGAQLGAPIEPDEVDRRRRFAAAHSWPVRAEEFLGAIGY